MAVSKTTNGGSAWSRSVLTASGGFTYALAVDPSNSNIVYAGGDPALYKSTNAGSNWSLSSTGLSGIVRTIAINPGNSSILYAGTDLSVFKSTNSGANWVDFGLDAVQALLMHPSAPETVYAGTATGVYQTTNSGSTWTPMNTGLDNLDVTSLGINPGNYLFCGTRGSGMYRNSLLVGVEEQHLRETTPILTINPNPFRRFTRIKCQLPNPDPPHSMAYRTTLKIYDASGCLIKSFALGSTPYALCIFWDGTDDTGKCLPAGVYFCKLECGRITAIEKAILLK
jgi:hypothetical protein